MVRTTQLEEQLQILNGATVIGFGRAVDMGIIDFSKKSLEKLSLHVQCPFRVHGNGHVLLGSNDMRYPKRGADRITYFDTFDSMFDSGTGIVNNLIGESAPIVTSVVLGSVGTLSVFLSQTLTIEAFPNSSGRMEMWRLVTDNFHCGYPPESI